MYPCEDCGKQYCWPQDLKRHKRVKHKNNVSRLEATPAAAAAAAAAAAPVFKPEYTILNRETDKVVFPFISPSLIMVSGATMSGKTEFVLRLIREREHLFTSPPKSILYAYSTWQDKFEQLSDVTFHEGLPNREMLEPNSLCIIDDLMTEASSSLEVMKLFTIDAHHKQITVIFLTQVIFPQWKYSRILSLQAQYFVLFGSKRDRLSVSCLGRQMFPGEQEFFMNSYDDATSQPFGYLVVDLHQKSSKQGQLRTKIFPAENPWLYEPI